MKILSAHILFDCGSNVKNHSKSPPLIESPKESPVSLFDGSTKGSAIIIIRLECILICGMLIQYSVKLKYATYFCFRNFLLPKSFDVNVRVAETLRSRQKAFYQNNAIIKEVGELIIYARMIWILKLAVDESSVLAFKR